MKWNYRFSNLRIKRNRKRLKNHSFSIIASNCIGAFITHDLQQEFRSPFVNLFLFPKDFIKFCKNIEHYLSKELTFTTLDEYNYPIGVLDDIKIHFMHYKSEQDAKLSWEKRSKRINFDNLFFIFTDRDGCTYEDLKAFDSLPYKNKVVFTNKKYKEFKSAYYIKGFEKEESIGQLHLFTTKYLGKKGYDHFNYVKWLNKGMKK